MPEAVLSTNIEAERRPLSVASAIVLSLAIHGAGLSLISSGLLHRPGVREEGLTQRYAIRTVDLHSPEQRTESAQSQEMGSLNGTQDSTAQSNAGMELAGDESGKQTLLQPDFRTHANLAVHAPLPALMIWMPELASTRIIVPPLPDQPTSVESRPSLDAPNEELTATDHPAAAANTIPRVRSAPAGTMSPLVLRTASPVRMAPATVSRSANQPTPTSVLSLSDLRMTEGTLMLPPVNETRAQHGSGGTASNGSDAQKGHPNAGSGSSIGATETLATQDDLAGAVHIQLPKDGRFGIVAVGTSISDDYPETLPIWNNRVAYTVYLHVGLPKNWILQYAATHAANAASAGTVERLEAPWAYDIMRPNLISRDMNSDAIIVHGMLNETGRFESLAIAFPAHLVRGPFILHALQRWQFRPARQRGKPVSVEVLLIIPDQVDLSDR